MSAGEGALEVLAAHGFTEYDGRYGTWTAAGQSLRDAPIAALSPIVLWDKIYGFLKVCSISDMGDDPFETITDDVRPILEAIAGICVQYGLRSDQFSPSQLIRDRFSIEQHRPDVPAFCALIRYGLVVREDAFVTFAADAWDRLSER